MSERELKILEELEADLRIVAVPVKQSPWSRVTRTARVAASCVTLVVALLLTAVGVSRDSAGGVVLAMVAYVVTVFSAGEILEAFREHRAALRRR